MEIKEYDMKSYKLHILKSDKVKKCHMEVHFKNDVNKDTIFYRSMLTDILSDCSKKYKSRKEVVIELENLYKATFYGTATKIGNVVDNIFVCEFINPKFISDKNYLEDVIKLPIEMILNPLVENEEFDKKIFEVIKSRAYRDVISIKENPVKLAISNSLTFMDSDSNSSISVLGSEEDVIGSTSKKLYEEYVSMINNDICDVYVIGDIDFDLVYHVIDKYFKIDTIKSNKLDLHVKNNTVRKHKELEEDSSFVQSNLNLVYNLRDLTEYERNIVMGVYNYILGSGGMSSKLYRSVREKNSLCYGVYSLYLKYDGLLIVQVSLDEVNRKKAISLIKNSFKDMQKGKITKDELDDAIFNLVLSLKMALDSNISILSNYIFNKIDNLPPIEERIKLISNVSLKDIKTISKKIKLNSIYTLKGGISK